MPPNKRVRACVLKYMLILCTMTRIPQELFDEYLSIMAKTVERNLLPSTKFLGTLQKFGIFHLKRRARKLAALKLSSGPQTSETCEDVANEHSKDLKRFDGRSGPCGPAIGGQH